MMKPSFDIVPEDWSAQGDRAYTLLIEISRSSFTYLFFLRDSKTLQGLKHYPLELHNERTVADPINQIINADPMLQQNIRDAIVVYNYPESSLIPLEFFNISITKPVDALMHGNAEKSIVLSERITGWDIYNTYRVPRDIHALVQHQFAAGKYWHFYSLLVASVNKDNFTSETCMKLIFYSDRFIICVFHHKELFLLNTYPYETPDDVAYYVLAVIQQLQTSPRNVEVELSGLIDEQSALYSGLMKYLPEVRFDTMPASVETRSLLDYYPHHYFSPLLRTIACV